MSYASKLKNKVASPHQGGHGSKKSSPIASPTALSASGTGSSLMTSSPSHAASPSSLPHGPLAAPPTSDTASSFSRALLTYLFHNLRGIVVTAQVTHYRSICHIPLSVAFNGCLHKPPPLSLLVVCVE
jgi:hypothetical protein